MTAAAPVRAAAAGLVLLAVLPGCQTTADKSARLEALESSAPAERGLKVRKTNPDVRVVERAVISDANGTAVVVTLRARGGATMRAVPIAIDVRSAKDKSIFRNNEPGTEPALVSVPVLEPGRDFAWVHDQVPLDDARPASVNVRVGVSAAPVPPRVPELSVTALKLTRDPTSGTEGVGRITNRSTVEQRDVTIFAVARRGAKVVAAGRARVRRLLPGKTANVSVFFIGNPANARISVAAPPSVLG